jgi:hypothetical protein
MPMHLYCEPVDFWHRCLRGWLGWRGRLPRCGRPITGCNRRTELVIAMNCRLSLYGEDRLLRFKPGDVLRGARIEIQAPAVEIEAAKQ